MSTNLPPEDNGLEELLGNLPTTRREGEGEKGPLRGPRARA